MRRCTARDGATHERTRIRTRARQAGCGGQEHAAGFDRADALGIVIGNLVVLGIALWQQLPAACLVWPYWFQSVIIGVFHRRRILALAHFNTEGFTSNAGRCR
jgi:hypothetical protein